MAHGNGAAGSHSARVGANTSAKQLAAAGAGGAKKPPPFWESWGQQWNQASQNMSVNASGWVKGMQARAKTVTMPKFEMPVRVDVDFLNPLATSVKKSALDTWRQLPPQAQLALPFVATGATTGLIVYKIQGGRLRRQREHSAALQAQIDTLLLERDTLKERIQQLKAKALAPNSASEMRMAHAVAESAQAAAAAAAAAASAASMCSIQVQRAPKLGSHRQHGPALEAPR